LAVAADLRAAGSSVDVVLEKKKMKWAFKHAGRRGAKQLVVVGPDDVATGEYVLKDLVTGEQTRHPFPPGKL
jgi:histidyl-tRNA synthetase